MPSVEITSASAGTGSLPDLADRLDPVALDQDDAVRERRPAEAIDQPAADQRDGGGVGKRWSAATSEQTPGTLTKRPKHGRR